MHHPWDYTISFKCIGIGWICDCDVTLFVAPFHNFWTKHPRPAWENLELMGEMSQSHTESRFFVGMYSGGRITCGQKFLLALLYSVCQGSSFRAFLKVGSRANCSFNHHKIGGLWGSEYSITMYRIFVEISGSPCCLSGLEANDMTAPQRSRM